MTFQIHRSANFALTGTTHGWTDQNGPDFKSEVRGSQHAEAVDLFGQKMALKGAAWTEQVHGGTVLKAEKAGCLGQADAIWTDQANLAVVGRSADCPLVLVAGLNSANQPLVGFAHASWRSTVRGITASLLDNMITAGVQSHTVKALICPSAGPCCYEVGDEVKTEAMDRMGPGAEEFFLNRSGKLHLDLWAANTQQLRAAGVPSGHIASTDICTICGGPDGLQIYPSYRRQKDAAGRYAAMIGIRNSPI